jgi:hypothetical protein
VDVKADNNFDTFDKKVKPCCFHARCNDFLVYLQSPLLTACWDICLRMYQTCCVFKHDTSFYQRSLGPLYFLGVFLICEIMCLFFHQRSLICTKVEPMSDGYDSASPLMASLFSAKALVEYGANFVSDFECGLMRWGRKILLLLWGTRAQPR